jgi:hypothetical protein
MADDQTAASADKNGSSMDASPFTAPQITLPKGGGAIRGIGEKFSVNPDTGAGSLNSPLPLRPGRSGLLEPLLANAAFMKGTLVVVTFDESLPYADNHDYTALLGEMVKAGTVERDRYDHYSLLRTIEENFGLGTLHRNDLTANWFRFLWGIKPPAFNLADHVQ